MDTLKNSLGSRIKHFRKKKGMKQATLAELTGVEINTISRYETGAMAPSIEQLLNLAEALDVSPIEILHAHVSDSVSLNLQGQQNLLRAARTQKQIHEQSLRMDMLRQLLGSRIKRLRRSKGMNQRDLAQAAKTETSTISRYETGVIIPNVVQLLNLAEALDVSPMEILPPHDPLALRVLGLRQDLADKAERINSSESLEELIRLADTFLTSSHPTKS